MAEPIIKCPQCGTEIPLTETLSSQIKESLRREYESKAKAREKELADREKNLQEEIVKLEALKKDINAQVEARLKVEKNKILAEAKKETESKLGLEMKDLQAQLMEKDGQLGAAQTAELEFRKQIRDLEAQKKSMEIEIARRLDKEREKIKESALEMFSEEHRLKDLEKDKKMGDMLKTIEELKRKAEQGSMQIQGEVLELDLEGSLKAQFPSDDIQPVPKGMRGADIIQKVHSRIGQYCGTIIWETKRTKRWSDEWLTKLKEDQREAKADISVIATEALPEGIKLFKQVDGVWVTDFSLAACLAEVLRAGLMQVSLAKVSAVGKNEKMEALYQYLSGPEFMHRVEAVVEVFVAMRDDLEKEKRAATKQWAKREKQIERVVFSTAGMYGDMQGIIGASLPDLKLLEAGGEDGETAEEKEGPVY